MHALQTGRKPRVVTAMTMLKQMLFRYAFNGSSMPPFSHIFIQISRASWSCTGLGRRWFHRCSPLYNPPSWLYGQASVCYYGFWKFGCDGCFWKRLEAKYGGEFDLVPPRALSHLFRSEKMLSTLSNLPLLQEFSMILDQVPTSTLAS